MRTDYILRSEDGKLWEDWDQDFRFQNYNLSYFRILTKARELGLRVSLTPCWPENQEFYDKFNGFKLKYSTLARYSMTFI